MIDWINSPTGHKKMLVLSGTRYVGYGMRIFEDDVNFCFFPGNDYVIEESMKQAREEIQARNQESVTTQ